MDKNLIQPSIYQAWHYYIRTSYLQKYYKDDERRDPISNFNMGYFKIFTFNELKRYANNENLNKEWCWSESA